MGAPSKSKNADAAIKSLQQLILSRLVIYAVFVLGFPEFYRVAQEQYVLRDVYAWLTIKEFANKLPKRTDTDRRELRMHRVSCDPSTREYDYDVGGVDDPDPREKHDPPCPFVGIARIGAPTEAAQPMMLDSRTRIRLG
jgi:hypothetical protein